MIAFDISVNGERVCTAGVDSHFGILTAIVSWVKRDVDRMPADIRSEIAGEEFKIAVSGQKSVGADEFENYQWRGCDLKPGDEIHIAIVDVDRVDAPQTVKKIRPKYVQKNDSDRTLH
jgi:hypothetical protein